ncbi:MAG: hypothetical protein HOH74_07855, partial [Gemmatimonadetes bacterium]|nr:hypothetical protein [Gemmatimonadota bacterium]
DEETGQNLTWSVRELTTTKQLVIEGKVMSHCVRSYTRSCRTGRKAVFSVQRQVDNGRTDRMLTVAIHPEGRRVIQARGKHNAAPVGKIAHLSTKRLGDRYPLHLLQARAVMRRWEEQQGLIPAKL